MITFSFDIKNTGMVHDINKLGTKVFFNLDCRQFELVDNIKSPLAYTNLLIYKFPI